MASIILIGNSVCKRFAPEFSNTALANLTQEYVWQVYGSLVYEGILRNGILCGHLILRRLLHEADREGLLEIDPLSKFRLPFHDSEFCLIELVLANSGVPVINILDDVAVSRAFPHEKRI